MTTYTRLSYGHGVPVYIIPGFELTQDAYDTLSEYSVISEVVDYEQGVGRYVYVWATELLPTFPTSESAYLSNYRVYYRPTDAEIVAALRGPIGPTGPMGPQGSPH